MDNSISNKTPEDVPIVEDSIVKKVYWLAVVLIHLIFSIFESLFLRLFKKPKSLRNKVCLVTGSGHGFGRMLCLELAKEGAIVACADINERDNNTTLDMVKKLGARSKAYKMNVASKAEVEEVIARIEDELGPISLLVNNAAIVTDMEDATEEFIRTIFNVNTLGPIWTSGALIPRMKTRNEGHIVFISSASAHYGFYAMKHYSATKAALTNFAQGLRIELMIKRLNIKITTIHPFTMNTSKEIFDLGVLRSSAMSNVKDVLKETMTAIKYEEEDCYNARVFHLSFYPPKGILRCLQFTWKSTNTPNEEEFLKTRFADTMKASSLGKAENDM